VYYKYNDCDVPIATQCSKPQQGLSSYWSVNLALQILSYDFNNINGTKLQYLPNVCND